MFSILDRYLLRAWFKIFIVTALGFPLVVTVIEVSDRLSRLIERELTFNDILLGHLAGFPEKIFQVIPAAVLFATVFSVGSLARHSELVAIKAAGRSFHRAILPVLLIAVFTTGLTAVIGDVAPITSRRQAELLGDVEQRERSARYNFVYRAEQGWIYMVTALDVEQDFIRQVVLERKGIGRDYPTLLVDAAAGRYDDTTATWVLQQGRYRVISGMGEELNFSFDSTMQRAFHETPEDLLEEPKAPNEMRFAELGDYIEAQEYSGGEVKKLQVQHALKLAIPFTCIIIALFGAPLANTSQKSAGAFGIGVSLGTTIFFLILVQLSQAVGAGGILPPTVAAWAPNMLFGAAGVVLFARART